MKKNAWSVDIAKIAKEMGKTLDQTTRAITLEMFNSVIDNTRADTGRAKGNWQTTAGTPAASTIDRLDKDGMLAKAEVRANVKPRSLMIISNNLPYIRKLEDLDGMVGKTVARVTRIVKEKAK